MAQFVRRRAFTLIELLVVVAIIALLISILLPSLQGAREQGKRALCLSNMKQIGQASQSYAVDDPRELLVPGHRMNYYIDHGFGFGGMHWGWRTALPFAYGGRTPQVNMPTESGYIEILREDYTWGAPTRPLNRYVYGEIGQTESDKMPLFRCPADTGYPDWDPSKYSGDKMDWDAPPECAGVPLYDFAGNSFRINTCGLVWLAGASTEMGDMSVGAEGHSSSAVSYPARVPMYCEPLFYWWSRQNPGQTPDPEVLLFNGWHRKIMADNVVYCDGSARNTKVEKLDEWEADTLADMGLSTSRATEWWTFLRRGRTWQTDCYPSPGALKLVYAGDPCTAQTTPSELIAGETGWPFDNYTVNGPPCGY